MSMGTALPPASANDADDLAVAGRCVLCGMCLPACPTYGLKREESDSPRGRIALIRALADGALEPGPGMLRHLDACLQCRRCEAVCPARVPFGDLMDRVRARTLAYRSRRERWMLAALGALLAHPRLLRGLRPFTQGVGWLRRLGLWPVHRPRALALFPSGRRVLPEPAQPESGPVVALFRGCVAEFADHDTLSAARRVLLAVGFRVVEPEGQVCCGALHQHAGDPDSARRLVQRNRGCFAGAGPEVLISTATGCGAWLAADTGVGAAALGPRHRDIVSFLAQTDWPGTLRLRPLRVRVFVHAPCSLEHAGSSVAAVHALLARVPGIEVVGDESGQGCCGAAGRYMLTHPSESDALGEGVASRILAAKARVVVTANIGCRLHLEAVLRRAGWSGEVLHPVTVLARQLESPILRAGHPPVREAKHERA